MRHSLRVAGVAAAAAALLSVFPAANATVSPAKDKPTPTAPGAPGAAAANAAPLAGTVVIGSPVSIAPNHGHGSAFVACPAGKSASGGGGSTSAWDIFLTDTHSSGNGWLVDGVNTGTTTQTLTAWAVCE